MSLRHIWDLLREGANGFLEDQALSRGAAIAFYAMTALAPILYLIAVIAGFALGRDAVGTSLARELRHFMGHDAAALLQAAMRNSVYENKGRFLANIIGIIALIVTASGLFGEMQSALNAIWKASANGTVWWRLVRARLASLALVLSLGLLLMLSLMMTAIVNALGASIRYYLYFSDDVVWVINFVVSFVLITILFAAIFKVLPDKDLEWRDVIAGAIGTSVLCIIGEFLIGTYLGTTSTGKAFGPAGGLMVLMLWIYYTVQIFLLGAEFTKVYANHHGSQKEKPTP